MSPLSPLFNKLCFVSDIIYQLHTSLKLNFLLNIDQHVVRWGKAVIYIGHILENVHK